MAVGARAEAWCIATTRLGIARWDRRVDEDTWADPADGVDAVTDRLVPDRTGALPLSIARRSGDLEGVHVGMGEPAVVIGRACSSMRSTGTSGTWPAAT